LFPFCNASKIWSFCEMWRTLLVFLIIFFSLLFGIDHGCSRTERKQREMIDMFWNQWNTCNSRASSCNLHSQKWQNAIDHTSIRGCMDTCTSTTLPPTFFRNSTCTYRGNCA
jgi:hypothetical protein